MKSIVSLSHNDCDALGCQLNIEHKFPGIVEYFNTNYANLNEKVDEIERYVQKNIIKLIIISDVSFAECRHNLISLASLGVPVIFIDHHLYPDGFFDDMPSNLDITHDKSHCATTLTHVKLGIQNEQLEQLGNLIEHFDIWQIDEKNFPISFYMNEYFWNELNNYGSIQSLMVKFQDRNYQLPADFAQFCAKNKKESDEHIQSLRQRNLIYSSKGTTIAFMDKFYNHLIQELFADPENKSLLIVNSWGSIKVRFNARSDMPDEKKLSIRRELLDVDVGHMDAFSYNAGRGMDDIMREIKRIAEMIQKD